MCLFSTPEHAAPSFIADNFFCLLPVPGKPETGKLTNDYFFAPGISS